MHKKDRLNFLKSTRLADFVGIITAVSEILGLYYKN